MFAADDSASLTIDELTWLSASTLIENHYAPESSSPDRGSRALFNTVFGDSESELGIERDQDDDSTSLSRRGSPPMSSSPPRRAHGLPGSGSPTRGTTGSDSPTSSTHGSVETGSGIAPSFQPGRQPITPPPTPPRRHLHPRYLTHDIYSSAAPTPPSPSPSVSSSTLSSTSRTEWLYRRPKPTYPAQHTSGGGDGGAGNSVLLNKHGSANNMSASASCSSRQVSRSPSICSSSYRTTTPCDNHNESATSARSSKLSSGKHRQQQQHTAAAAKPRPSSPVLISSTSQLVDALDEACRAPPGLECAASRSPSVCSGGTTNGGGFMRSGANASVSSLQLQSSIRVSPLKNRKGSSARGGPLPANGGGSSTSLQTNSGSGIGVTGSPVAQPPRSPRTATGPKPKGIERSSSSASTTTNKSTGKPIWSALRAKSGADGGVYNTSSSIPERNRILLKSIPSQSQISDELPITPTFVAPPPSTSLPMFNPPTTPTRIRHTLSGTSAASSPPSLPQKDKDRSTQRRDKFASAPPIQGPIVGVGARTTSARCPSTSSTSLTSIGITSAKKLSSSPIFQNTSSTSLSSFSHSSRMGMGVSSSPSPKSPGDDSHPGAAKIMTKLSSSSHVPRMGGGRKRSSSSSTRINDAGRDRTSSLTSQISIATATTAHTATTTRTTSSSASSIPSHPATPATPSPVPFAAISSSKSTGRRGEYSFRSSSNSSLMNTGTTPPYENQSYQVHHLRGLGNGGCEQKPSFLLDRHQPVPYQHRHQRQSSTSSSVSFNGSSAAVATTAAARSQAYAQLTGTAMVAGIQGPGRSPSSTSSKRRRPSTSPGSGSGSETSSIHSHPYSRGLTHSLGLGLGSGPSASSVSGYGNTMLRNGSASTLMPLSNSNSTINTSIRPTNGSSASLSRYGNSLIARSPRTPHSPGHDLTTLPKAKSILTRTSSMSTKNSACGGTVKSVKFVEIPEVHYRSGCYEHNGNEYVHEGGATCEGDPITEDEGDHVAVDAKGEGQEGLVLKNCMGIDVEAIDMDIDTYLGIGTAVEEEKESRLIFKMPGLNWGFLSRGKTVEKDNRKEDDDPKETITPDPEQKKEEKSLNGFGLRRLMGFGTRKVPPPPISIPDNSPYTLGLKSTQDTALAEGTMEQKGKKSTSPPVSPRKPISGPYVLGSHIPSRSPPAHSPISSHSSSFLHYPISSRSIPASSSNTSLNRANGGRQYSYQHQNYPSSGNTLSRSRSRSIRSVHRTSPSPTTLTNPGMSTERPVGPNIAGTRPKGLVIGADVLGLTPVPVPLKNAQSYESFRSAKSFGGRSEVGSMKSTRSAGGGSIRSFRAWMGKVGAGVGNCNSTGVTLTVVE